MTLAGGIAAALFERERTGRGPVVDVSLLGTAMWSIAPGIVAVAANGLDDPLCVRREDNLNPLSVHYRTRDGRFIKLSMLQSDRHFGDLCARLDAEQLANDDRFVDSLARSTHRSECVAALDEVFARYDLAEIRDRFRSFDAAWAVVQAPKELLSDPQVLANGYLPGVVDSEGEQFPVVAAPVQFDEEPVSGMRACPSPGEHTDEILEGLGLSMDAILELKISGAVL
jgi:crotonobetainyl-CoA:carnitine CoA-transferase CaiB-like acyl-CoA transferase